MGHQCQCLRRRNNFASKWATSVSVHCGRTGHGSAISNKRTKTKFKKICFGFSRIRNNQIQILIFDFRREKLIQIISFCITFRKFILDSENQPWIQKLCFVFRKLVLDSENQFWNQKISFGLKQMDSESWLSKGLKGRNRRKRLICKQTKVFI